MRYTKKHHDFCPLVARLSSVRVVARADWPCRKDTCVQGVGCQRGVRVDRFKLLQEYDFVG